MKSKVFHFFNIIYLMLNQCVLEIIAKEVSLFYLPLVILSMKK